MTKQKQGDATAIPPVEHDDDQCMPQLVTGTSVIKFT